MTVGLMQPYFFPYIGQFQIINAVDRFILVDELQYIKAGWMHRNRILKPNAGWQYIVVTTGHKQFSLNTLIKDVKVMDEFKWKEKIIAQIEHYKKIAPYYKAVRQLLCDCFSTNEKSITKVNAYCFKLVCDYIGIEFETEISSEMNFNLSDVTDKEDRAVKMCKQLGASRFINPDGGIELYNKGVFKQHGIDLFFLKPNLREYDQRRKPFEPGLSIIDIMMFNSPEEIRHMLNDYQLI